MPIPVIFLAFANDRVDDTAYLRNLPKELSGIRQQLTPAVKAGLCEVVERANATIEQIIDVFQDERYQNRVAIFHYGGHANGYQLLLEALDGSHASAHSEGLVSFLAKQRSLQAIFLNGCSSQQQALDLLEAGLPAVIGTSQSINDDVATMLSIRFYGGLAKGYSLHKAWGDAVDEVKIHKGTANMRDLFWDGVGEDGIDTEDTSLSVSERFPWEMHYKDGAEIVKRWSLPEAAANPLFGLPNPPKVNLPEQPYRFLERYNRSHAEVFFGRSYYIRTLFQRATDPNAAPILLFYGQSGVGKSSMLDAGLFPRLDQVAEVLYVRRDVHKGLLGTLRTALGGAFEQPKKRNEEKKDTRIEQLENVLPILSGEAAENVRKAIIALTPKEEKQQDVLEEDQTEESLDLKSLWFKKEEESGKPLVVLLDQVEEAYTKPNPALEHELELSLAALYDVFGDPKSRPQGKLILSYRKEYHPEIEEGIKKLQLPRENIFLRKLEKRDIIEIVNGLTSTESLKNRYQLEIEADLPEIIADDLLEDRDSPIAPVLQILLTKMWRLSEQEEHRIFSVENYQYLKKQGILMDDFFKEQMELLRSKLPELEQSGLALDVLYFHTTKLATADVRNLEELRERYGAHRSEIDELLQLCKDLYLLTDAGTETSGLAHDTLAPIIQKEFRQSDKAGQRASIILENKVTSYKHNPDSLLDAEDLTIVETGASGMRIWLKKEEELVEKSREKERKARKYRKNVKRLGTVGITLIILISMMASYATFKLYKKGKADAFGQTAQELAVSGNYNEAFAIYKEANNEFSHSNFRRQAFEIYSQNKIMFPLASISNSSKHILFNESEMQYFIEDGSEVLVYSTINNKSLVNWKVDGQVVGLKHAGNNRAWAISNTGKGYLLDPQNNEAVAAFQGEISEVMACASLPNKKRLAVASKKGKIQFWKEGEGTPVHEMQIQAEALTIKFSKDLNYIAAIYDQDSTLQIWDVFSNKLVKKWKLEAAATAIAFNPKDNNLLVGFKGFIQYWNWKNDELITTYGSLFCHSLQFRPSGENFLKTGFGTEEWNIESGEKIKTWLTQGGVFDAESSNEFLLSIGYSRVNLGFHQEIYTQQKVAEKYFSAGVIAPTNQDSIFFGQDLITRRMYLINIYSGELEEILNVPASIKNCGINMFFQTPKKDKVYLSLGASSSENNEFLTCYQINDRKWLWVEKVEGQAVGLTLDEALIIKNEKTISKLKNSHQEILIEEKQNRILFARTSKDGRYLFIKEDDSNEEDDFFKVYDINKKELLYEWNEHDAFIIDDVIDQRFYGLNKAVAIKKNGDINLYDLATNKLIYTLGRINDGFIAEETLLDYDFDESGHYFYIIGSNLVKIWDLELRTEVVYPIQTTDVFGSAPSYLDPNGHFLLFNSLEDGIGKQELHPYTYAKQLEKTSLGSQDQGGMGLFLWYISSLVQHKEIKVTIKPEWVETLDRLTPESDELEAALGMFIVFSTILIMLVLGRKYYKKHKTRKPRSSTT